MIQLPDKVEMVKIDAIAPYARNAKTHPEAQVKALAEIIREYGWTVPVVIDAGGCIIAGHCRLEAARRLGMESVPCIRAGHLTTRQVRALRLADNRVAELGAWDVGAVSVELADLPEIDLPDLDWASVIGDAPQAEGTGDADPQTDRAAELQAKWATETGQLWLVGEHRLLCGDSTRAEDVARLVDGAVMDCVFTSLPYAVGVDYGETYTDNIESLRVMLAAMPSLWNGIVCEGGFAIVNFGDVVSGKAIVGTDTPCEYPMAVEYWPAFRKHDWALWSRRVWCKPVARVAAPWCASSNRSATNYEHVWTWKRPGSAIVGRVGSPMDSQSGWIDTSKLEGVEVGKRIHGAAMPTGMAEWMLRVHSRDGSAVHEPCCGTGTTMVAAQNLGRKCYGMEIAPQYVAVILERMATAFPGITIKMAEE